MSTSTTETPNADEMVRQSVGALLDGLIDFAGLFPPAKLDMATTVADYARFMSHEDSWMMSRLIVPFARLDEFETHRMEISARSPMVS